MIRTVWLALWCLAGSCAALAISVGKTPTPEIVSAVHEPIADAQTDAHVVDVVQDTLTEADRLDVAYVRGVDEAKPAAPSVGIPAALFLDKPKTVSKLATRRLRGNSKTLVAQSPTRQSKNRASKVANNVAHAKASVAVKPCRHPEGFAGFLRLFNLGPRCEA
jgi:hypothetical protein